jgi:hypothetical protein
MRCRRRWTEDEKERGAEGKERLFFERQGKCVEGWVLGGRFNSGGSAVVTTQRNDHRGVDISNWKDENIIG